VTTAAFQGLVAPMHTAFGPPGLPSKVADALLRLVTKTLENP
jgi:hypothetical protein